MDVGSLLDSLPILGLANFQPFFLGGTEASYLFQGLAIFGSFESTFWREGPASEEGAKSRSHRVLGSADFTDFTDSPTMVLPQRI